MRMFSRRAFLITAVLTPTLAGIRSRISDAAERLRRKFMVGRLVAIEDPHNVTLRDASGTHTIKFLGDGSDRARATFNRDGIRDPQAVTLARLLSIQSTPFVVELERGRVTGKAYLQEAANLTNLIAARQKNDLATSAKTYRKEAVSDA